MVNLNDENRPDKVAERFTKLYNDEWTDCLEVLKLLLSEEKVCQMLIGICVKIYTTYANAFDKRQKEHAWLKADTELAEYLNARLKSLNRGGTSDAINSYWTMCKEICKSMIAHDPPIYMDTDTDKHATESFTLFGFRMNRDKLTRRTSSKTRDHVLSNEVG
ncbi:hypothetical protein DPMN_111944 [Dreissena polymorpha]|uniref:Uncharacterized protein n=1 Tax=Dreissena polymorpha TaxID=45954 RepID=A0A9D4KF70_DREPO|nr:hypothetical protein DPMN_111944 [Dreissena polymorpha]